MMIYFWGYADANGKSSVSYMGVVKTIRGSAICDAYEWVECESCVVKHADEYPDYRINVEQNLVRRNVCNFEDWLVPVLCSYAATMLLLALMATAFWRQRKAEVVLDEAVQTASDYSIKVSNPPVDALNPEEWRQFFNQYACGKEKGVVLVTIALDNAKLIKSLIERRQKRKALSLLFPNETNLYDEQLVSDLVMKSHKSDANYWPCQPSARKLWGDIQGLEKEIRRLAQKEYRVVSVFVTFETERSQRNALHALSTGKLHVWQNRLPEQPSLFKDGVLCVRESIQSSSLWDFRELQEEKTIALNDSTDSGFSCGKLIFRGKCVLRVKEAMEPSDIRWVDLQASSRKRGKLYIASTVGMIVFVMWSRFVIFRLVEQYPGYYAAMFITLVSTYTWTPQTSRLSKNYKICIPAKLPHEFNALCC